MKRQSDWFYPTAFSKWGIEESDAIKRVVESNWFTYGAECEALESEFAEYHGMKHGVFVNSGSSANLLAVAALFHLEEKPLLRGDKVVVPALAWATSYAPLVQYGLDLVLADCDGSWNARTLVPGTRLWLAVHILGNPAFTLGPSQDWLAELRRMGCYLIEDNCESVGAWNGPLAEKRYTGTYGVMSTFSFFASHQISAIEGGMVLTNSDECARLCKMLRSHGWTRDTKQPSSFEQEYDFEVFGYNVRGLEMHAAIARAQLHKLEDFRRVRQQNLNNFQTYVTSYGLHVRLQEVARNAVPNPFGIAFTVESTDHRAKLVQALRANGIDCRLPTGGSFKKHKYGEPWSNQSTPNADFIHDCGLFLGNAPYDISPQIERAVKVIRETL